MPKDPQDEVKLSTGELLSVPERDGEDLPVLSANEEFGAGEPLASVEGRAHAPVASPVTDQPAPSAPARGTGGLFPGIVLALIVLASALAAGWYFFLR